MFVLWFLMVMYRYGFLSLVEVGIIWKGLGGEGGGGNILITRSSIIRITFEHTGY